MFLAELCALQQILVTCREADGEVSSSSPVCIMFDKEEVPATRLQPGVYRCFAPPHEAGTVSLSITSGNGSPCSNTQPFTYRITPQTARTQVRTRFLPLLKSLHPPRHAADRPHPGALIFPPLFRLFLNSLHLQPHAAGRPHTGALISPHSLLTPFLSSLPSCLASNRSYMR